MTRITNPDLTDTFVDDHYLLEKGLRNYWGSLQVRPEDWADPGMHCFGMLVDARAATRQNGEAAPLLPIMNSHHDDVAFILPEAAFGSKWSLLTDTSLADERDKADLAVGDAYEVAARSFLLFLLRTESKTETC